MSACIADRLAIVSSRLSPLAVDERAMSRLITSADSRFAAISKVVRVRVEFSKKRLNTALPRSSGTFFTSRSAIDVNGTAVSRMRPMTSAGKPSSVNRCASWPFALSCGSRIAWGTFIASAGGLRCKGETAAGVAHQLHRQVRRDGEPRAAVRRLDRQLAPAAVDQHGELDARRTPVV